MGKIGKRVVDDLYIHLSAVCELEDAEHRGLIEQAIQRLPTAAEHTPSVAKLNLRTGRLSLLAYRDFDDDPFPELAASWGFAPGLTAAPSYRIYAESLNPPILHRKELLVPPAYPGREGWVRLTSTAESLGLFDDTTTIGFKLNWQRLVESKGYRLDGDEFVPLGNDLTGNHAALGQVEGPIQRHLTALTRSTLSAPVQLLFRHGLLPPGTAVFDYGCGRGGDVAGLAANGFTAHGWDPHFAADQPIFEADVVNLGFVVNVIEYPAERVDALHKAFKLARRAMSVGSCCTGVNRLVDRSATASSRLATRSRSTSHRQSSTTSSSRCSTRKSSGFATPSRSCLPTGQPRKRSTECLAGVLYALKMSTTGLCPFCALPSARILLHNDLAVVVRDAYPVSPGHTLVIPVRHVASFFDTTADERSALLSLMDAAKWSLQTELEPAGYNIGINDGPSAGQTVGHLHVHLIPRYLGDRPDPRGGIRWVIPENADYWTEAT